MFSTPRRPTSTPWQRTRRGLLTAALLPLLATGAAGSAAQSVWLERESFVMGTRFRLEVGAPSRQAAAAASEAALAEVRRLDAMLSTWDPETEMSRLNRAPVGVAAPVSRELFTLLAEAGTWSAETNGAFQPALGPLLDAWDLRGSGRQPSASQLERARDAVAAGMALEHTGRTLTRRHPDIWLDTGAFGKGAALAAAAAALAGAGVEDAALDFGGQMLALGSAPQADGWRVAVAHPRHRDRDVGELLLRNVSAATSGASERFVEVGGQSVGHVLDPRTGHPVPAWGSVTVVTADPLAADALSTALFVLGPRAGMAWARDREDVAVLFLEDAPGGLVPHWNTAMERWLSRVPGGAPGGL